MMENLTKFRDDGRYSKAYVVDRGLFILLSSIVIILAILYAGLLSNGAPVCADFMGFYAAGQMGARGELARAYDPALMNSELSALCGKTCSISFVHPPSFGLIAVPLSALPAGASYFLFISTTLLGYFYVLRRLSTSLANYNLVRVACLPAIIGVMLQGQTGFLTAALVGFFCLEAISMRSRAGVPLGLMVIKPHLVAGIVVMCALKKRWAVIGVAGGTCLVILLIATFCFGADIWPAFATGISAISRRLADGDLPLAKMTSIYASFASLGASPAVSSSLQALSVLLGLLIIFAACRMNYDARELIGVSIMASFGFSPYVFYYDWTVASVGLALLLPTISRKATLFEGSILLSLFWLATGWGQFQAILQSIYRWAPNTSMPSGMAFLSIMALTFVLLQREEKPASTGVSATLL